MKKFLPLLILIFTSCGGLLYNTKNSGIYELRFEPTVINCSGDEKQKIKAFKKNVTFKHGIFDFNFMDKIFSKCPKTKLNTDILGNFYSKQDCQINKIINKTPVLVTLKKITKGKFEKDFINGEQILQTKFIKNGVEIHSCETTLKFSGKLR